MVSIVVLNWNGKRYIDKFITSYLHQSYPQHALELLFVDNGSSDDSVDYVKLNYGHLKNLHIIQNGGNFGYAGGNNRGIKQATGNFILVCNNDLELAKDLVRELVVTAKEKDSAVVVPKLMFLNKPGYINNAGSRLEPNSSWPIYDIGINEKDVGQYSKVREISAFCGACVLFSREFLMKVGMFDSKFFMYFEDGDLSWRGQKKGYKYYYAPKAVVYHVHTGSSTEGSPLFNHFVGRNRILILTKNATFRVWAKGWKATLKDQFILRVKRLILAAQGKYEKRLALVEFLRAQKLIWAAVLLTPYALLKRSGIIPEEKI